MERSLFYPLQEEGLTTLGIYRRRGSGEVVCRCGREWDAAVDWSRYNLDFTYEDPLCPDPVYWGHEATLELFRRHRAEEYLQEVVELLRQGKHQGIECFYDDALQIRFISNMHSNTLGIDNGFHAIRAGGIRRHDLDTDELEVIVDGLNLSRAMSFKNAGARVPFGGSKITVQCAPVDLADLQRLGFLAYCLDRTRSVTGPDMGFSPELADAMKEKGYSRNITGGYSRLGPTGIPTAYGVYLGLKEAMAFRYGTSSLAGRTIVVQGVGAVGYPLVERHLAQEEATILVADVDPEPVAKLAAAFPGKVRPVPAGKVLELEADIFMPCAVGGILDEEAIGRLRYQVVFGAANNQLKATSVEEEIRLARLLAQRDILFQVDWVHNAGGVIAGMEEYMYGDQASLENIMQKTEAACRLGTKENLEAAARAGITPTEQAYKHYGNLIYRG